MQVVLICEFIQLLSVLILLHFDIDQCLVGVVCDVNTVQLVFLQVHRSSLTLVEETIAAARQKIPGHPAALGQNKRGTAQTYCT